jgi:hypothetical protein
MVATGFTTKTGLTSDPTAFLQPETIPTAVPPQAPVESPAEESRRLVADPTPVEQVWEPTPEERQQFVSLLTCGKKSKVIDVMGHSVGIESLNTDDDLHVGVFTKEYLGTEAYARAVQLANSAAAIRTIDGSLVYTPLSPNETKNAIFDAKVEKLSQYHPAVITEIYREVLLLDSEFVKLAIKLGKLKG